MSLLEIPFEEMKNSMIQEIKKHEWGYLATSDGKKNQSRKNASSI
jgi:hypothetical protein